MLIEDSALEASARKNQMHRPIKEVAEYECDDDDCSCCCYKNNHPYARVKHFEPIVRKVRAGFRRLLFNVDNRKLHSQSRLQEVVLDIEALRSGNYILVDPDFNIYSELFD